MACQNCIFYLAQVFRSSFYMGCFGGPTAKRHRLWSNDASMLEHICKGAAYMPGYLRNCLTGGGLVRKYCDKSGKRRYVGIPQKLRASQLLRSNSKSNH